MGATGDSQAILNEVSKLRQKYDECRESQGAVKGIDPKVLAQAKDENQKLMVEITRKEGVIKSLEQTMLVRDRSYRETNARNKNLITQLHTQNVTQQEREMLKKALIAAKGELALAQKELRGGSSSIVKIREELKTAKAALAQLQATPSKAQATEKIVYKDRIVTQEKVVYKDRPVEKEKVVEKIIYKDRPIEKIVEKVIYKDRPVEKVVIKTVVQEKSVLDENVQRKMDKLALDLERQKSLNTKLANDLAKAQPKRVLAAALPPLAPLNPAKRPAVKTIVAQSVKTVAPTETTSVTSKKSSGVYRMTSDATVYSSPNGKAIAIWEARRSFTGSAASNGWIHITGYFVNRVFQATGEGESLWVKESDAIRR